MRQTLLRIPIDADWSLGPLGSVPGFGWGVLLAVWVLICAAWTYNNHRASGRWMPDWSILLLWIGVGWAIVAAPELVHRSTNQAIAAADAALRQDPELVAAYRARSDARFTKRDYAGAIADLERALEIAPSDADVGRRLGWLLATVPSKALRDGTRADELARRFCEDEADASPNCLDILAAAAAESGRFEQAVDLEQRAAVAAGRSRDSYVRGMVPGMRRRLALYDQGQAYRDDTAGKWIPIFGYGFMLFLGFLCGGWTAARRVRHVGLPPELVWDLAMWIFLSGIVGARLFFVLQYHERILFTGPEGARVLKAPLDLLLSLVNLPDGGLVLYGGVLLGAVMYFVFCSRRRVNPLLLADACVPSVFVGLAFGRLGCFLNGCCYGDRCALPWQVRFPLGSLPDSVLVERGFVGADALSSLALHPTQLYSSLNAVVLALLTHFLFRSRKPEGTVTVVALTLYPLTRIVMEFLRGDEMGKFGTGLTISQLVSLGVLLFGVALGIYLWSRTRFRRALSGGL